MQVERAISKVSGGARCAAQFATAASLRDNGSHYVRDTAFAEDASRIRKNPDIVARLRSFAYNLIRLSGGDNIRNARWRAALDINLVLEMPTLNQN